MLSKCSLSKTIENIKTVISNQICLLINECFSTGVFPDSIKFTQISLIFKSGNCQIISNYRPISVLYTLSKIFEKAIASDC